jgi:hypothetical protein
MLGSMTRLAACAAAGMALTVALVAGSAGPAAAYGGGHLDEITLSYNCQNTSICSSPANPFGIGGLWGWVEPDQGGSVDGQLEFQGHANTSRPYLNGQGHTTGFTGWSVITCTASVQNSPDCGLLAPEGVPADPGGQYFDIGAVFGTTIGLLPVLTPATPGNYSAHVAPGVFDQVQVHQV